jgi:hypothetical protein
VYSRSEPSRENRIGLDEIEKSRTRGKNFVHGTVEIMEV